MPGPSLGTNLSSLVDWSTASPFVDIFKMSRPWTGDCNWEGGKAYVPELDSRGWVRSLERAESSGSFTKVGTILDHRPEYLRAGHYVLDWKGEGDLQVFGAEIVTQSGNRMVLDLGDDALGINIVSTDPGGTGKYIRDIRLYHEDDRALLDAGVVFNPAFTARVGEFRVLRFMDWMATNDSSVQDWNDARAFRAAQQASYGVQAPGASLDVMVALANETGADPWFTIPHKASADYIRKFATYVREHLDPRLVARFEYSNEVWNGIFDQHDWANAKAQKLWGIQDGAMEWYGVRSAQMARIVADVFGEDTGKRALNVFATQADHEGLEQQALGTKVHGGSAPRNAPFHVYAINPYFGTDIGSTDPAMVAQVKKWIGMGSDGIREALKRIAHGPDSRSLANLDDSIAYHAAQARKLGWQLEAYEGGQHVADMKAIIQYETNAKRSKFFNDLIAHPKMGDLYERYFDIWRDEGGGLMANFTDFGLPTDFGTWGLWKSPFSGGNARSRAVEDFRDDVGPWWGDKRPGSVFEGIRTFADYKDKQSLTGTGGQDRLFGLNGNDRLEGRGKADSLYGNNGNDLLLGGDGRDSIWGGYGHDRLRGGADRDRLKGGPGNDIYVVDKGDVTIELAGQGGADRVQASASWTLARHVENLTLLGTKSINGTGNAADNRIEGNAGANRLSGLGARDVISGRRGEDTLEGGYGQDRLFGGSGDDRLAGGRHADRLTGGSGDDSFVFRNLSDIGDSIHDFSRAKDNNDQVRIDASAFGGGLEAGDRLPAGQFQVADDNLLSGSAEEDVRFIFEADATRLWFDQDGSGAGAARLVADLQPGAILSAGDIWLF